MNSNWLVLYPTCFLMVNYPYGDYFKLKLKMYLINVICIILTAKSDLTGLPLLGRERRPWYLTGITKMYWLEGDLNCVVCERVTSTRGIRYCRTAIRWYISSILSQLLHLKKYQEIKKSQNPSYFALAYFPQRQWMHYTTNRTLRLQSIHCPLRGKRI